MDAGPRAAAGPSGGLCALSYFSEAGSSLQSPQMVSQMVAEVRASNADQGLTGAIAYEDGCIRQWIEGPEASVARLWDRIRLDPRHRVRWAEPPAAVTARHFPGSPMKLALTVADLARIAPLRSGDVVALPPYGGETRTCHQTACLSCTCRYGCAGQAGPLAGHPLWQLDAVFRARIDTLLANDARALIAGLTGANPAAARVQLLQTMAITGIADVAQLMQAALDRLQAGWMADETSSAQRQVALTALQSALRQRLAVADTPRAVGSALVCLLPGTPDIMGVMLKVALLRQAHWSVRLVLAQTAEDIPAAARHLRPDLVVVAGSRMVARTADLCQLRQVLRGLAAETVAPVVVGGKLAEIDPQTVLRMGADRTCIAMADIAAIAAPFAPGRQSRDHRKGMRRCTPGQVVLAEEALTTLAAGMRPGAGLPVATASP